MKKKFGIFLTVAAFTLAHIGPVSATSGDHFIFTDVPENAWYAESVWAAARQGIVSGYRDAGGNLTGLFGPGNDITVAEALKMAIESAGYDADAYDRMRGADAECWVGAHWACMYVSLGHGEAFYSLVHKPNLDEPATRAQVAQIVADAYHVRALDVAYTDPQFGDYTDVDPDALYSGGIEILTSDNVMVGDNRTEHCRQSATCKKTTFRPNAPINRAEVTKVVMTARAKYGLKGENVLPVMPIPAGKNAAALTVAENAYFSIAEESNPSIGWNWVATVDEEYVMFDHDTCAFAEDAPPGSECRQKLTFFARKKGTTKIVLTRTYRGETSGENVITHEYTVTIQ